MLWDMSLSREPRADPTEKIPGRFDSLPRADEAERKKEPWHVEPPDILRGFSCSLEAVERRRAKRKFASNSTIYNSGIHAADASEMDIPQVAFHLDTSHCSA